jgi:integrase
MARKVIARIGKNPRPPLTIEADLGHSDTSTTLDIYAHALKSMDVKIADALEDMIVAKKA